MKIQALLQVRVYKFDQIFFIGVPILGLFYIINYYIVDNGCFVYIMFSYYLLLKAIDWKYFSLGTCL